MRPIRGALGLCALLPILFAVGFEAPTGKISRLQVGASRAAARAPTPGNQIDPAVASDGSSFLVAWEDWRKGQNSDPDVYAARVDASGNVLDPDGIPISTAPGYQGSTAVAYDGANYLVVWADGAISGRADIRAARVRPDGVVLDPGGIVLTTFEAFSFEPAVAFDGVNYLVVFTGGEYEIRGVRLAPDGTILDPNGILIAGTGQGDLRPSVSHGAGEYLVTWERSHETRVYGARVTPEGAVLDPEGFPVSTPDPAGGYIHPSSVYAGSNFVVSFDDRRTDSTFRVYAARVTGSGSVLDPAGIPITPAPRPSAAVPSVAFDGVNSLIVSASPCCLSSAEVTASRLAPDGIVLDPDGIKVSSELNGRYNASVAFGGANYLAAWEDGRDAGAEDIIGARITPSGVVLDPAGILISGSGPAPPPAPAPPPPPPVPPPTTISEPPPPQPPIPPPPRCTVPRVIGLRLKLAKARIRLADCRTGRIGRVRSGHVGRVVVQNPRAGARRRPGARVDLVVGRR